ncbi:MAG: tRNA-intron lyase [Candidatus Pacearchaeota archaeon]|nr:tRNA-intron lyase [Candidatus Pacearchaeota archaeon]
MITSHLSGEKITSTSTEAFSLFEKSRFGEKKNSKIEYSLVETLYLLQKNKLSILQNKKQIDFDALLKKVKRTDKRIETKLPVYTALRNRGYILKTALKFGADFRVYKKGIKPGQDHALWVLFCVREQENQTWYDFAAKNRVAHSTKKKLLIGIVDDESDVTFYEVSWVKP